VRCPLGHLRLVEMKPSLYICVGEEGKKDKES
jgi:hypothetical protein